MRFSLRAVLIAPLAFAAGYAACWITMRLVELCWALRVYPC